MSEMNERYLRQLLMPEIGNEGQQKLAAASVLVIGAGGLGSPTLQYLTAAGIGHIDILDGDTVSLSNLNRQILYGAADIGKPKAECAAKRLSYLNDEITIRALNQWITEENCVGLVHGYDVVAFCLDKVEVRRIANRACVEAGVPYVDAGVVGLRGSAMTVFPGHTACYSCLYHDIKPVSKTLPVLGAMAGIMGSIQALAVIRLLIGLPDPTQEGILLVNGKTLRIDQIPTDRNPDCPVCGNHSH